MEKAYFVAKTHPEDYSVDDLARDGTTAWDGVKNPQAVRAIRSMRPGDRVFIYHSGGISAVVGLAEVTSEARQDPDEPKSWVADFTFLTKLDPATTLSEIKKEKRFQDWALVRQGRLSTMAAPKEFVSWMRKRHKGADI